VEQVVEEAARLDQEGMWVVAVIPNQLFLLEVSLLILL
jgi:hypothetical protein